MNDRYHAFGRQGFGAIFGSKNLKAVVVDGGENTGRTVPVRDEKRFRALCDEVNREYRSDISLPMRLVVKMAAPKKHFGFVYRTFAKFGIKIESPQPAMRQMWADRGTTAAVALSVENGDAPLKNWTGVGARDFPLAKKGWKLDGAEVDKMITKKLSCGDCPAPCKGIVGVRSRGLSDVRRPDYETIVGFGANILNDDLELVTACHDACNRYGMDAVSSSATIAWVCEAVERCDMTADDLDGVDMRWGNGEGALALTVKMGEGEGCGEWLRHGLASASRHVGRGTDAYAVHVGGQEPAYHDPRFTSLMGVTYIADPTPGRHTAGSASWNETFGAGFPLPEAVDKNEVTIAWKGTKNKGIAQAHYSNAHQTLNGLGLCMFTRPDRRPALGRHGERPDRLERRPEGTAALRRADPEPAERLQRPRGDLAVGLQAPRPHDGRRRRPARDRPPGRRPGAPRATEAGLLPGHGLGSRNRPAQPEPRRATRHGRPAGGAPGLIEAGTPLRWACCAA